MKQVNLSKYKLAGVFDKIFNRAGRSINSRLVFIVWDFPITFDGDFL